MQIDRLADAVAQVLDAVLLDGHPRDLNEADTRAYIIEPILSALGYATLARRRQEAPLASGQVVDYLLTAGERRVVVEAKALGDSLPDKGAAQLVGYCAQVDVRWALLTNGVDWDIFDTDASGDWQAQRIAQIDITAAQRDGRLAEALRPLALLAHDALAADDTALNAWAVSAQAHRHIAALLADPSSWPIQTIVTALARQRITIPPATVVELVSTRPPVPPAAVAPDLTPALAATPAAATRTGAPNHFLLRAPDRRGFTGLHYLKIWLPSGRWIINHSTKGRRLPQAGDRCCFYVAPGQIVAIAEIVGPADQRIRESDWLGPYPWTSGNQSRNLPLRNVQWLPAPIEVTQELRNRLDMIQTTEPKAPQFLERVRPISEHDFRILTGQA